MNRLAGITAICFALLLTGCSLITNQHEIVEWIDMLKLNGITYSHGLSTEAEVDASSIELGAELGQVMYKMADDASSDYRMKDGDAAYLDRGTPIYEVKGYPADLAVAAGGKVYIADKNGKAKTGGELTPLTGLVRDIYMTDQNDGSRVRAFSNSGKQAYLREWETVELRDVNELIQEGKLEGESVFIEIELNNGISVRQVYYPDENVFHSGAVGTVELQKVIKKELDSLE